MRLKFLNYLMRIRDPGWKKFGSTMEKFSMTRCFELKTDVNEPTVRRLEATAIESRIRIQLRNPDYGSKDSYPDPEHCFYY